MRTTELHSGPRGPRPAYSPRKTLVGTALAAVVFLAAVLAVTHPVATVAALVATAAAATVRRLGRRVRVRRHGRRSRRDPAPTTDACVEA